MPPPPLLLLATIALPLLVSKPGGGQYSLGTGTGVGFGFGAGTGTGTGCLRRRVTLFFQPQLIPL
jgi:hypothetical protein